MDADIAACQAVRDHVRLPEFAGADDVLAVVRLALHYYGGWREPRRSMMIAAAMAELADIIDDAPVRGARMALATLRAGRVRY